MNIKLIMPLLFLPIVWGTYYVATNAAVELMSIFSVGIVIRFVTMLFLTGIIAITGKLKDLLNVKGVLKRLLFIGIFGFLIDLTAFIGLTLSPVGIGTALLKCDIIFVNIISMLIYKYHYSKFDWAYTFIMLIGVFLIMKVNFSFMELGKSGNIFFILSALFTSINAFIIKSVQLDKYNPVSDKVVAYYNNFITMILFISFSILNGDVIQLKIVGQGPFLIKALLVAAVGQTLIYLIYYYNLRYCPVWIVKVFLLFMPIVTTFISFIIFNEKMTMTQITGMAVVLIGALGLLIGQKRKQQYSDKKFFKRGI